MKTRFTFLVLIGITLVSCSKWFGKDDSNEDEKIVLTEDNYIFEGDLYKYALNLQIDSLDNRANDLKSIIDNNQATQEIKDDYAKTVQNLNTTKAKEASVIGYDALAIRIGPRVGPRPPIPTVVPQDWKYVLTYNVSLNALTGRDEQGQVVARLENGNSTTLPDTGGLLKAKKVAWTDPQYRGAVLIRVDRTNADGETTQYNVQAAVLK